MTATPPTPPNYSLIPDELWTCDLSHGAARVLGWLWTSEDGTVTADEIRESFGAVANTWIAELTMAGFLDPHAESGDDLIYERVTKAWESLG